MANVPKKKTLERRVVARNRRAKFDYHIELTVEAGIELQGTEVKSLRAGLVSLDQAWARVEGGEVWLVDVNINEYASGSWVNHAPKRKRKLLLHRREIAKLEGLLESGSKTLVPLEIAFSERGYAKVLIGVGTGRRKFDKRDVLAHKEARREIAKVMRRG